MMVGMTETTDLTEIPPTPEGGIFEVPYVAPPRYVSPFTTMTHTWFGTDGSVWDFTDPMKGVFLVQEGIEGLHLPTFDDIVRESPSIAGGTYHGYRVKPRAVTWVLYVYSDESSDHFFDLDSRLWKSMRIGKYGTWRVTRPNGDFREISMRIQSGSEAFDRDPGRFGWKRYPVIFLADENPFWTVPTEVPGSRASFEDGDGKQFFGDDGSGAPHFNIAPSRVESEQVIHNPGDEDVWPEIEITGPMDSVNLKIGTREYEVNCNLLAGEHFYIRTDPRNFRITDDEDRNRIKDISAWVFDPTPWGEDVPLVVTPNGTGGGTVVVKTDPLYHRAW